MHLSEYHYHHRLWIGVNNLIAVIIRSNGLTCLIAVKMNTIPEQIMVVPILECA